MTTQSNPLFTDDLQRIIDYNINNKTIDPMKSTGLRYRQAIENLLVDMIGLVMRNEERLIVDQFSDKFIRIVTMLVEGLIDATNITTTLTEIRKTLVAVAPNLMVLTAIIDHISARIRHELVRVAEEGVRMPAARRMDPFLENVMKSRRYDPTNSSLRSCNNNMIVQVLRKMLDNLTQNELLDRKFETISRVAARLFNQDDKVFVAANNEIVRALLMHAAQTVKFEVFVPEMLPYGTGAQFKSNMISMMNMNGRQLFPIYLVPDLNARFYIKKSNLLLFSPIAIDPTGDAVVDAGVPLYVQLARSFEVPTYGACRQFQFCFNKVGARQVYDHPAALLPQLQVDDLGDANVIALQSDEIRMSEVTAYVCEAGVIDPAVVFRYLNQWNPQ